MDCQEWHLLTDKYDKLGDAKRAAKPLLSASVRSVAIRRKYVPTKHDLFSPNIVGWRNIGKMSMEAVSTQTTKPTRQPKVGVIVPAYLYLLDVTMPEAELEWN